ncbi:hypothetical protein ACIZ62_04055 [Acetobacterium carbinolicum]|uniref:hypothetical protein n=1 Tax=Acetobacterium carbinolicum TaxID=52690 RepID=UPI0039BF1CFF
MDKSFKIKIDDTVLAYMSKKKKRDLTLTISSTGGGCCPTFEISEVSLKKPDQSDLFDIFQQNDVTVYISKNVKVIAPTLRFTLKKNLIGATIQAEGLGLKRQQV